MTFSSKDETILQSALHLSAELHAFRTRNGNPLSNFLGIPGYQGVQSRIVYTLWKITEDTSWKTMLLTAFPRSPEAEIARETTGVKPAITPQWLFLPLRENPDSAPSVSTVPVQVLQTGLYSREDNAKAMADRLSTAGFRPEITRRSVNGVEYWAVNVRPGLDIHQTISELRIAGFESFLVQ